MIKLNEKSIYFTQNYVESSFFSRNFYYSLPPILSPSILSKFVFV